VIAIGVLALIVVGGACGEGRKREAEEQEQEWELEPA
jgi:hypothetical protein